MKKTIIAGGLVSLLSTAAMAESIGVSMSSFDDNFLTVLRNGMMEYAGSLEDVDIQVEDALNDVGKQLDQINNFIASGVDPDKSVLFNQSQVSAHAELAWIFNCVARMGWMKRMTQWKDKAGKNQENASLGLFAYPALMAADILTYHATHVPVGEDQKQHIELTRDIAIKFNNDFGVDFFPITEPVIEGAATRVMSTPPDPGSRPSPARRPTPPTPRLRMGSLPVLSPMSGQSRHAGT